jgi:four helix bundle protein
MAKMFENLDASKQTTELAIRIYEVTAAFPKEEIFGITSQLRRAAVSISSNIAEGAGRKSKKDFGQFIHMASGSLNEAESLLFISFRLNLVAKESHTDLKERVNNVGRLIGGLLRYLDEKK